MDFSDLTNEYRQRIDTLREKEEEQEKIFNSLYKQKVDELIDSDEFVNYVRQELEKAVHFVSKMYRSPEIQISIDYKVLKNNTMKIFIRRTNLDAYPDAENPNLYFILGKEDKIDANILYGTKFHLNLADYFSNKIREFCKKYNLCFGNNYGRYDKVTIGLKYDKNDSHEYFDYD